ncbi:MAG: hypothetical protein K0S65_5403, partial [Labilithrix sp.]|nr:hypothetical protein [Labilithrix sp.]
GNNPPGTTNPDGGASTPTTYVLGSVVIDTEGKRTTYVQSAKSIDNASFTNANALEVAGNGVLLTSGSSLFVGLAEEPTWVRYSVDANGKFTETGRLSFLNYGISYMDFANAIVDGETAVSVLTGPKVAVLWNTQTMTITGEVDLSSLAREGWELEAWTTTAYNGKVYIPGRWADWTAGRIRPGVSLTILDPKTKTFVTAEDDRCTSGGRIVFDAQGYGYVMADGRSYSAQMYAHAASQPAPTNCLLRIAPGQTTFEKDYFFTIPSLTGGPESMGELDTAKNGPGIAFAKMFHRDQLPAGMEPVDFEFWDEKATKMWRLELGNPPTAKPVEGVPFAALGFTPVALDGLYYSGESPDGGKTSDVYEIDPATNVAKVKFKIDGYFYGVAKVELK